jgi:hypothetical protein
LSNHCEKRRALNSRVMESIRTNFPKQGGSIRKALP